MENAVAFVFLGGQNFVTPMHLDKILCRVAELAALGAVDVEGIEPCVAEEIDALERKLRLRLPGALREFYLWAGKNCEGVFGNAFLVDFDWQLEHDHRADARKILVDAGLDPSLVDAGGLVVQMDYDGQFALIPTDRGEDPPVFNHNQNEALFCSCERFTDYLALMIEQCAGIEQIELVRSVVQLKRFAQFKAHLILHLVFGGGMEFPAIPEEVFAFKELRSLNVVGKGIIEISPRIRELAFLKRLELARNSLTTLPMALAELEELEELDISENQLSGIVGVLERMPALRVCMLAGNPISEEEIQEIRRRAPRLELVGI